MLSMDYHIWTLWALSLLVYVRGAVEMFKDPGFENTGSSWTCPGCKMTSSNDHRQGHHSIQVTSRQADWAGPQQSTHLKTNSYYYVQFYIKQTNNHQGKLFQKYNILLDIEKNGGSHDYTTVMENKFVYTGSGWVILSSYFKFEYTDHKNVVIRVNGPDPGINFIVDDSSLTEIPEDKNWKSEANARIEKIRKNNIHFNVHVPAHISTSDLEIKVDLVKHGFPFGSQTTWEIINKHPEYKQLFYYMFNWATLSNFYWEWSPPPRHNPDYSKAMQEVNVLHQHGIPVRAHNIFWGADTKYTPDWVQALSPDQVKQAVDERIQYIIKDTKGKVEHWDVNNELVHGQWFEEKTGDPNYTKKLFTKVHHADPHAKLFLNDFSVVSSSYSTSAYYHQAMDFKAANVGVYGLGVQCHFGDNKRPDPTLVKKRLDLLGSVGLPLWVTEMDIVVHDKNTRAEYYDMLLRLTFSHPDVEGIILWGFWEKDHWRGADAAIVDANFKLNAAGQRYVDLLYKEWSTHVTHKVSSGKQFNVRGFHGDYNVVVKYHGNVVLKQTFKLGKQDKSVDINIPSSMNSVHVPTTWSPYVQHHSSNQVSHIGESTTGHASSASSNHIDCMNRYSAFSQIGDDKMTAVSCPSGYVLTGCTSKMRDSRDTRDGERIEDEGGVAKCKAFDSVGASAPVQAVARCCKLTGLSCEYRKSGPSQAVLDQKIETRCLNNKYAMGCAAHSFFKYQDGTYPTLHSCIAQNQENHDKVESFAACCSAPHMTCKVKASSPSGDKLGNTASVGCDHGWVMVGCSAYSDDSKLGGAMIEGSPEKCIAVNGAQRLYQEMGATAYATCCHHA